VILCERGIRTFEPATRNTLDLSAVPVLRERSHLPVFVDPSHGVGVRRWIGPLCRAAKAVGAHGLLIEVHPNPPEAKSDKDQALTFGDFAEIVSELDRIPITSHANAIGGPIGFANGGRAAEGEAPVKTNGVREVRSTLG
jgi:3-deoxy-D-arabino-heptulosonate 7-phosphate (DAHP) synthase